MDNVRVTVSSAVENVSVSVDSTTEVVTVAVTTAVASLVVIRRSTAQGAPVDGTTAADYLGQQCIVGDDPGPYLVYVAGRVSPSVWSSASGVTHDDVIAAIGYTPLSTASLVGIIKTTATGTRVKYAASDDSDAARGDALSVAMLDVVAGDLLEVGPGSYLMHAMCNFLLEGVTYKFNGNPYIYIDGSSTSAYGDTASNWLFYSAQPLVNKWRFLGPVTLDGASLSGRCGIVMQDGSNRMVQNVRLQNFAGIGLYRAGGTNTYGSDLIDNVIAFNCGTGINNTGEYALVFNSQAFGCATGWELIGGNNQYTNCFALACALGVWLRYASNGGHSVWTGGAINHCVPKALMVESTFVQGFTFMGTNSGGNGTGGLDLTGQGVNWVGGEIDSAITCSGTQAGVHTFQNVLFYGANTDISGLTSGQRANIRFWNCVTTTGQWAHNDQLPGTVAPGTTLAHYGITDAATISQGNKADTALQVAIYPGMTISFGAPLLKTVFAIFDAMEGNQPLYSDYVTGPTLQVYPITGGWAVSYGTSSWHNTTSALTPENLTGWVKQGSTSAELTSIVPGSPDVPTPAGIGAVAASSGTATNLTITNFVESPVDEGTVTTSKTIDLTSGTFQTVQLTASTGCAFTMPTVGNGKSFTLIVKQAAATGNGTATFTGVDWGSAGTPTITATAGKMDILSFVSNATKWCGSYNQGYTA